MLTFNPPAVAAPTSPVQHCVRSHLQWQCHTVALLWTGTVAHMWEEPSPADLLQAVQLPPSCSVTSNTLTKPQTLCHCAGKNHPHAFSLDRLGSSGFSLPALQDLNIVQRIQDLNIVQRIQDLNAVQRRTTTMPSYWTSYVLPLSVPQLFKNWTLCREEPLLLCFLTGLVKYFLFQAINCSRTATFTAWRLKASTTHTLSLARTFQFWCPSCSRAAWLRKRTFTAQREALGISLARQVRRLGFS